MRCLVVALLTQLIICKAKNIDFNLTPICITKLDGEEQPCAHFRERPLEKLTEESWTEQAINRTSYGSNYSNITIVYIRRIDMDPKLVMIRYDKFPLPLQSWEIQPVVGDGPLGPLTVTIAFNAHPNNYTTYQIRRIVNHAKLLEDQSCLKNETIQQCNSLKNSKLYMRNSWGNSTSISLSSEYPLHSLFVEVLSAHCNITCRGDINPCSGVEIKNLRWDDPTEALKIHNLSNDTTPLYYCARISPLYHECCMIYTETVVLQADNKGVFSVTFSQRIYLPECFMVISILLALIIILMITTKTLLGANSYKCWPYYSIGSQGSVEDDLLPSLQEETSPSKLSVPPAIQQQYFNVEVLLVYYNDSEEVEMLMSKFRYILSFYAAKVWDPFDEQEIEKVSENAIMWLDRILSRDQVKVILIESKATTEWYEKCLHGPPPLPSHHLEGLFIYMMSILHNNPYLCHNYRKLFTVRFSSSDLKVVSTNVVPCTRYEIPQNLGTLITDLAGPYVKEAKSNFKPPLKEIQELEKLDNEIKTANKRLNMI